ncbi:flavodoxin family protein [Nonomuraea rubra]|uniref:flavodoxin family protein n=1 Tax=Nonomuraea rubra TaxID=46180 RepID=UPI003613AD28
MDALVIYESMYGNTKKIAEAVAEGLATRMRAEVVEVGSAPPQIGKEIALLVVGGPTHAFSMSRASTRQPAAHAVARRLRRLGVRSVAPAESFYVTDIRGRWSRVSWSGPGNGVRASRRRSRSPHRDLTGTPEGRTAGPKARPSGQNVPVLPWSLGSIIEA